MKLRKFGMYGLAIALYVVVIFWLSTKIWGTPRTTHEKGIHQTFEEYETNMDTDNMKYDVFIEFLTLTGHKLCHIKGYQIEKRDGIGVFTVDSLVLKSDKCTYLADIRCEKLDDAILYTNCRVESDKIFFRTTVPTDALEAGVYEVGFLLDDETVLWTSKYVIASPYSKVYENQNELGVFDEKLWFNHSTDCFEGVGGSETEAKMTINNISSKSVTLTFRAGTDEEKAQFNFVCNGVTIVEDMQCGERAIKLNFPLKTERNEITIRFISDDNDVKEPHYYLRNLQVEFGDIE